MVSFGKTDKIGHNLSGQRDFTLTKASYYSKTRAVTLMKKKPATFTKSKGTYGTKINHYNFGLTKLIITTMCILGLTILYTVLRYFVINNQTSTARYLTDIGRNACRMYTVTLMFQISLLETIIWNNTATVGYKPALEYYSEARASLEVHYKVYLNLLTKDEGDASKMLKEKLGIPMCESFRNTEEGGKDYVNCDIALGGINMNPIWRWWPMYMNLGDSMVRDWKNTVTQEDRNALFLQDEYASFFLYSMYNLLGTADANYYNVMFPTVAQLILELDKIMPVVNLTNIISGFFFLFLIPLAFRFVALTLHEILQDFWKMVYSIPLNLIETNPRLKQKFKLAYSSKSFTKFG